MKIRPWSEKIWFSPCYVINNLTNTVIGGDRDKIKRHKEAWIAAIGILSRSRAETGPWWMQIPKKDPPDALAMRLIPTPDGKGQYMSELKLEVFEISEHDSETIEESLERKLRNQDYNGMVLIGFVRRKTYFDHVKVSGYLCNLRPKAGSVNLIIFEERNTNVTFIQLYPELIKFKADFGAYCKAANQKDFIEMRRGSKAQAVDADTTDKLTLIP